jgi:hypothetical protein
MSNKETVVLSTPTEINFGRFSVLKGKLKLESKGLKTHGPALRGQLAQEFGLKPRDSYDKYIQYCVDKMNESYVQKHGRLAEPLFTA